MGSNINWGCVALRWVAVLLFILAGAAIDLWACLGPRLSPTLANVILGIAIGLAAAAVVVLVIWLALDICSDKPCRWALLLAWQVLIGYGIVSLYFIVCRPILLIGPVAIGFGIAFMIWWWISCRMSGCTVAIEASPVLAGIIAAIGYVLLVPGLKNCISSWVGAVVGTISAILLFIIVKCASSGGGPAGN